MPRVEKTIFISYRRTNLPWALAIYQNLTAFGYDVFFDYQTISSGDFEKIILENVRARAHFLVLLTPSALERLIDPGDWMRREIETAIEEKRNIIPMFLESFDIGNPSNSKYLIGKLATLKMYNGLTVPAEYFDEALRRLRERFLNVAIDTSLIPLSETTQKAVLEQKSAAIEATSINKEELSAQEWFERGYVFAKNQNYDEAIRCFSEAIIIKPDDAYIYNNRGNAFRSQGNLDRALADYNEAIRLAPDFAEAYSNRGVARSEQGNLDGAIQDYNESIRLVPNDPHAFYNRGGAYQDKGELNIALDDYTRSIELNYPELYRPYNNRGLVHQLKGNLIEAIKDYEEAIRIKPDYGSVRVSLIDVFQKLGRISDAVEQERLARPLMEKENEYNQACFETLCGNFDRALELLKIAIEKKPSRKDLALRDPDLENLRDDPRFKALVDE